ncbi:MAG: hypothetical protein ATN36_08590 [Epulopiscium sp. Nele67-Bin005]|nr:MAG: hypothetical protein ATN36_08590 [Epulopiscium sp. Nele67-Bin005]
MYCGTIYEEEPSVLDEILDYTEADVTGDGQEEKIYLMGKRPYNDGREFISNMYIRMKDGHTQKETIIPMKVNKGYAPKLFIGDFDKNGINDIMVTFYKGGSGGYNFAYIFSTWKNEPELIFDTEQFNEEFGGNVKYEDGHKVRVSTTKPKKEYVLDISEDEKAYLDWLYDEEGYLKTTQEGEILELGGLYPTNYNQTDNYDLRAVQRVTGMNLTDTLGLLETFLEWNSLAQQFEVIAQYLSVYGKDI